MNLKSAHGMSAWLAAPTRRTRSTCLPNVIARPARKRQKLCGGSSGISNKGFSTSSTTACRDATRRSCRTDQLRKAHPRRAKLSKNFVGPEDRKGESLETSSGMSAIDPSLNQSGQSGYDNIADTGATAVLRPTLGRSPWRLRPLKSRCLMRSASHGSATAVWRQHINRMRSYCPLKRRLDDGV